MGSGAIVDGDGGDKRGSGNFASMRKGYICMCVYLQSLGNAYMTGKLLMVERGRCYVKQQG